MKKTILKSEIEVAFAAALKAIRSYKGKRISILKAFELVLTAMDASEVKIRHIR